MTLGLLDQSNSFALPSSSASFTSSILQHFLMRRSDCHRGGASLFESVAKARLVLLGVRRRQNCRYGSFPSSHHAAFSMQCVAADVLNWYRGPGVPLRAFRDGRPP